MQPVRSLNDNEPAYIQFQNKTSRKIDIVWINYVGTFKKYVTLKPLESINIDTFKTHPWIFVDTRTGVKMMVGSTTVFYPLSNREVMERLGLNNEQNVRVPIPIRLPLFSLRQISLQYVVNMLTDINDVKHLHLPIIIERDIEKLSREKIEILSKYE